MRPKEWKRNKHKSRICSRTYQQEYNIYIKKYRTNRSFQINKFVQFLFEEYSFEASSLLILDNPTQAVKLVTTLKNECINNNNNTYIFEPTI